MNRKNGSKTSASGGSTTHYLKQPENAFESRPSNSGFQSFLKWFRKNERERFIQNTSNINANKPIVTQNGYHKPPEINIRTNTPSPITNPTLENGLSSSASSCDSVFSTATTSFAFISPNQYRPFGELEQAEKLIAPGPTTDTYRHRLQANKNAREHDRKLELTLRKKYNIFDSDTLTSAKSFNIRSTVNPHFSDLSLPQGAVGPHGQTIDKLLIRRKSHRRTVSDSSKDKKAGAYVHVKGKRRAPPPPIESDAIRSTTSTLRQSTTGTLSPASTIGRKKRRAPPPPSLQSIVSEDIPTVLENGLFDDEEIRAIIGDHPSVRLSTMFVNNNRNSDTKPIDMDDSQNSFNVPSTDTLRLEKGVLKSNKEVPKLTLNDPKRDEISPQLSPSAISPRPWYKRSLAANKDYAVPFKKEITLRTMEKRKGKHSTKEKEIDSPLLPEVGFCRNSSLFEGFFSRIHHDKSEDVNEKRKSGIGMPNISELDREAAEILSKEQESEKAKIRAEGEKFFCKRNSEGSEENFGEINSKRTSTKDLISKFEKFNPTKMTINNAYLDKSDRPNGVSDGASFKCSNVQIEQTNTNKTNSTIVSIFSQSRQTQDKCESEVGRLSFISDASQQQKQQIQKLQQQQQQQQQHHQQIKSKNIANPPDINKESKKMWTCVYCTLENPHWRVICEVCERFKPFERQPTGATLVTTSIMTTTTATTATTSLTSLSSLSSTTAVIATNFPAASDSNPINNTLNKSVIGQVKDAEKPTKEQKSDWESKAEKVMKYFRPKSTGNSLSKSASETSVGRSSPFSKKFYGSSKLADSTKLDTKHKSTDRAPSVESNLKVEQSNMTTNQQTEKKQNLIDSSAVVSTVTTVFVGPEPKKQEPIANSAMDELEKMRQARLAKFSSISKSETRSTDSIKTDKQILSDPDALEREKERLREMIRAMNARALAEKYPVIQKSLSLDNPVTTRQNEEKPNTSKNNIFLDLGPINEPQKLGAIKKVFNRKQHIDDKEIADSRNYSSTKSEKDTFFKVSSFAQTSILNKPIKPETLQLPSPIQELNEDSPISPTKSSYYSGFKEDPLLNTYDTYLDDSTGHIDRDLKQLEEISQQLNTQKGLDDFKATLKFSNKKFSNTNTLALNKILKNLEAAIANGEHELAANLAMDLAKMKVSLSVTKQQNNGKYKPEDLTIIVDMYVEDKEIQKGPIKLPISPAITVSELKSKIFKDYQIPKDVQRWIINDRLVLDDAQILTEFAIQDKSVVHLYIISKETVNPSILKSDIKLSNILRSSIPFLKKSETIELDNELGAQALPLDTDISLYGTLKVGWACPLCTLINSPNRPDCMACSETRPGNYKVPDEYKLSDSDFQIPDELKKFLADDPADDNKVQLRRSTHSTSREKGNDLNKVTVNRKSAEIFNITVQPREKIDLPKLELPKMNQLPKTNLSKINETNFEKSKFEPSKIPQPQQKFELKPVIGEQMKKSPVYQTSIVMTAITTSPNITKNKYRGVDNYNPQVNKSVSDVPSKAKGAIPKPTIRQEILKKPSLINSIPKESKEPIKQIEIKKEIHKHESSPSTKNSNHYAELLDLDNVNTIPNAEAFDCPICFTTVDATTGVVLRNCLHTFCRDCLANTIKYSEEAEVSCPYMDNDYSCDSFMTDREIRALVTKDEYEQHLAVSLRVAENRIENAFHCKTPNCKGWCIYEDNVNEFRCPICRIVNCLTCRVIHDGLNCKQYQDQMNNDCDSSAEARRTKDMLAEMIEKGDAMNCPTCQVVLMKKWGCDWLKCSMCKTEICWVTRGVRWGPEGKGDTSGGCKCGVNGIKCHPKCNYCH